MVNLTKQLSSLDVVLCSKLPSECKLYEAVVKQCTFAKTETGYQVLHKLVDALLSFKLVDISDNVSHHFVTTG